MANSSQTESNDARKEPPKDATAAKSAAKASGKKSSKSRVKSVDPMRSPVSAALEQRAQEGEDPDFEQRYVRNDPLRMQQVKMLGYEAVEDEEGKPEMLGNLVLMRVPREQYEERQAMKTARTQEMTAAPREGFKTTAKKAGVEVEDKTRTTTGRDDD